jgi:copper(I)-binding protein
MLIRPTHALKAGDRAPATLTFAKAGPVKITFVVEAAPTGGMTMR